MREFDTIFHSLYTNEWMGFWRHLVLLSYLGGMVVASSALASSFMGEIQSIGLIEVLKNTGGVSTYRLNAESYIVWIEKNQLTLMLKNQPDESENCSDFNPESDLEYLGTLNQSFLFEANFENTPYRVTVPNSPYHVSRDLKGCGYVIEVAEVFLQKDPILSGEQQSMKNTELLDRMKEAIEKKEYREVRVIYSELVSVELRATQRKQLQYLLESIPLEQRPVRVMGTMDRLDVEKIKKYFFGLDVSKMTNQQFYMFMMDWGSSFTSEIPDGIKALLSFMENSELTEKQKITTLQNMIDSRYHVYIRNMKHEAAPYIVRSDVWKAKAAAEALQLKSDENVQEYVEKLRTQISNLPVDQRLCFKAEMGVELDIFSAAP